jgi:uncharacterized protein (TIGR02246 family)
MRKFLMGLLLCLPLGAIAQTTAEEAAPQVFERFLAGLTQLDVDTVVGLFTEDALFWGTSRKVLSTETGGIREYFAALSGGQPGQNVASAIEHSVVELSDDTALLSGIWQVKPQSADTVTTLRVSMVVVRQGDDWKIAQFHNSAMPQ